MIGLRRSRLHPWAVWMVIGLGILALAGCGGADNPATATPTAGGTPAITVQDAWVRATTGTEPGQTTAAYLTLVNTLPHDERLIGARAEGAGAVEIHETTMQGEMMHMAPVSGVDVAAGASVALAPGGLHLMLLDLDRALVPDDTVVLTLIFESGLELLVEAPVRPLVQE